MTDAFTTAARAEAEKLVGSFAAAGPMAQGYLYGFETGVEWARDRIAQQEPTGDEHYAAAQVIYEATTEDDILRWPHVSDEETARSMNLARAALTAAKEARHG